MEWTKSGDDLLVRIDPGEEIHSSLQKLADEVGFNAAAITSGIGRTRENIYGYMNCLLYTSPSPRDVSRSRMPSSA